MDALNKLQPIVHWLVRLSFAATFIYHGLPKLTSAGDVAAMMGMSVVVVLVVGLFEVGGGILVLYGGFGPDWATRIGGLLIVPIMLGAIFMVHIGNGWSFMNNGAEFQTLLLTVGIFFAVHGNGIKKTV